MTGQDHRSCFDRRHSKGDRRRSDADARRRWNQNVVPEHQSNPAPIPGQTGAARPHRPAPLPPKRVRSPIRKRFFGLLVFARSVQLWSAPSPPRKARARFNSGSRSALTTAAALARLCSRFHCSRFGLRETLPPGALPLMPWPANIITRSGSVAIDANFSISLQVPAHLIRASRMPFSGRSQGSARQTGIPILPHVLPVRRARPQRHCRTARPSCAAAAGR